MSTDQLTPKLRKDYLSVLQVAWTIVAIYAVTLVVESVRSILSALANKDVPVPVHFENSLADIALDSSIALTPATVSAGTITVEELPIAGQVAMIIEHVLEISATVTFVVVLYFLLAAVVRGNVFTKKTIKLVDSLMAATIVFTGFVPFFGNMVSNSAFAQVTNYAYDNPRVDDAFPLFAASLAMCALVSLFFRVGHNLAQDSEGLV